MKTPMQELIEEMQSVRRMCDDPSMEMDIWHTLDVLIAKAELMLEKEKDLFCQFAKIYDDDLSRGIIRKVQDAFDETFRNNESAM